MTRFHIREKIGIFSLLCVITLVGAAAIICSSDKERPIDF